MQTPATPADAKRCALIPPLLQVEYQTLWRLPRTRSTLFTVRTYVEPVTELAGAPEAAAGLAASLRGMSQAMRAYKGLLQPQAQEDMLAYLDSLAAAGR